MVLFGFLTSIFFYLFLINFRSLFLCFFRIFLISFFMDFSKCIFYLFFLCFFTFCSYFFLWFFRILFWFFFLFQARIDTGWSLLMKKSLIFESLKSYDFERETSISSQMHYQENMVMVLSFLQITCYYLSTMVWWYIN